METPTPTCNHTDHTTHEPADGYTYCFSCGEVWQMTTDEWRAWVLGDNHP